LWLVATWNAATDHDPLLARLDPDTRTTLYGSLASSAGALLGFTIASLAILFTLDPDRPLVKRAQDHQLWAMLNRTLLVAAASLALVLVTATTALALDNGPEPCLPIEVAVFTLTVIAGLNLLIAGIAFALVVLGTTSDTS
jgi:hypothetical protein